MIIVQLKLYTAFITGVNVLSKGHALYACLYLACIILFPITISTAPDTGMVASICPQLRGQDQCCTDSMFSNANRMLKGQTIYSSIEQQSQTTIGPFRNLAKGLMKCKVLVRICFQIV